MNWGHGITILTLSFVGFMTFLVIGAFRQDFDLVTEDYYGKELKFQSQIDKQKNQQQLKENIQCVVNEENISIQFPSDLSGKKIEGEVLFFRPSDASKDLKLKIASMQGTTMQVAKKRLSHGLYKVQIDYKVGDKEYYYEDSIVL